jgi:hypothetical protein
MAELPCILTHSDHADLSFQADNRPLQGLPRCRGCHPAGRSHFFPGVITKLAGSLAIARLSMASALWRSFFVRW